MIFINKIKDSFDLYLAKKRHGIKTTIFDIVRKYGNLDNCDYLLINKVK